MLLVALAITLAGIFPFRQMIAQERQVDQTQAHLDSLVAHNEALQEQITALNSDAEVERLARERGLVRPGETGFSMEFEQSEVPAEPESEPVLVDSDDRSLLGQLWDFLTGRDLDPDD
jgi:hypothetical protein